MVKNGSRCRSLNTSVFHELWDLASLALVAGLLGLLVVSFMNAAAFAAEKNTKRSRPSVSEKSKDALESRGSGSDGFGTKILLSGKYLHFSCNRSLRDLEHNRLECFGNVYIRRPSELLTADYVLMDLNTQQLRAEGNVVYFTPDTIIYGSAMDYNFATEIGIVEEGRVESDKYQLSGERIERRSLNHYWAKDGEYTTCRDCPASWKIVGKSIDMTVNGYAKLSNVFIKINEAPAFYFPYMVVPVKTTRQSGLLFPRMQFASANGFTFVQPYFWAISRSTDATISAGYYTVNGIKGEGEFRFVLSDRSSGQFNGYYLHDKQFEQAYQDRWAINYRHSIELPWQIEQKINWIDISDRDYLRKISDISGYEAEPYLISEAGISKSGRDVSVWAAAKRIRNTINPSLVTFDPNIVQLAPSVSLASADHRFAPHLPLYWGLAGDYSRFWRTTKPFDAIYLDGTMAASDASFEPGVMPIRRGQRFSLVPEVYYTARVGDYFELVPSVQFRSFHYLFDNPVPTTSRGYLLAQAELSTTLESVYGDSIKHKFRPSLTYSNIPVIMEDTNHPFIQQIKNPGYQFDELDIVPVTFETQKYFVPLGNSLSYRLTNSFILKTPGEKATDPNTYKKVVDLTAGQSINFIEMRKRPEDRQPLSRFYSILSVDTLRLRGTGEFDYYPYINAPTYNLNFTYFFAKYTRRLLTFERSFSFSYNVNQIITMTDSIGGALNWSLNDSFMFTGGLAYAFPVTHANQETPGLLLSANAGVVYQSPSQCFKIVLNSLWRRENPTVEVGFNFPLNLTGEGFSDLQEGGGIKGVGAK